MSTVARLACEKDREDVMRLAEMQVTETLPHLDFDRRVTEDTFDAYLERADPTIFVAERDGEVVGYLMALLEGYAFTTGLFTVQEALYVQPDTRGSRASVALTKTFIEWSKSLGVREIVFGIANGFQPERTAKFFEHFGARQVGHYLKIVPEAAE